MDLLFILGRATELCLAELLAVIDGCILWQSGPVIEYRTTNEETAGNLMCILGGTIKIGERIKTTSEEFLRQNKEIKRFGISGHGLSLEECRRIAKGIKEKLRDEGRKISFVCGAPLSSVQAKNLCDAEILAIRKDKEIIYGLTLAIQNYEEWGRRDYGRPVADPHRGMMPPKIARAMINIARAKTILDPFCGSGTILAEAMMRGCRIIGSDLSLKAVEDTQKNLQWLGETYKLPTDYQIFQADATHISEKTEKVEAIVTEPYLGPNLESNQGFSQSPQKQRDTERGLMKLYLGCFNDWTKVLNQGGVIVIAFPSFKNQSFVKMLLDKIVKRGYTVINKPLPYFREGARVKRDIYQFKFKN